ncbi:MAG: hypothetical protein QNJ17_12530 [Desulfocapsaceae bacterium]|nr:hypothetical protein [Desulfocapsaceae bacterium]
MDTVTYSSTKVAGFTKECLITLAVEVSKKPYYERYNAIWTPTLLLLDFQGNEIQRNVGFLDVEDFMACMHLGIAKVHLNIDEFAAANVHFKKIFNSFSQSFVMPEAIYFQGVNGYKESNDPAKLKQVYERLHEEYPESGWTRRAVPYNALN